jgi:hypothetical protein
MESFCEELGDIFSLFKLRLMITTKLTSVLILYSVFLVGIPDIKLDGGILKPSHSCIVNDRLRNIPDEICDMCRITSCAVSHAAAMSTDGTTNRIWFIFCALLRCRSQDKGPCA